MSTEQTQTIPPRPAPPVRPLTAVPLPHDLDPYTVAETVKPATAAPAYSPWVRPGALLARDLYDSHHADRAFGDGPGAA